MNAPRHPDDLPENFFEDEGSHLDDIEDVRARWADQVIKYNQENID